MSDLKDEINFLKNELASKNKIIEILHENSLRCNDISTQQNFKNIDEFQTIRTSSRVNRKANQANEFVLPTSNRYQCFDTADNVIFSTNNEKINDNDNYRKPTPIQTSSNKGNDVRKRPSFIPNHHEENQQDFRKSKQPSKTYSEAVNSENCRAKKKTIIFTDSIPKGIRMREFNYFIKNGTAQMKCFPGATSKDLNYYVIPTLENNSYDQVLIHVGINDLLNSEKPDHQSLLQNIMRVIQKCKDSGIAEIIISSLVVTEKISVRVIIEANESLRNFCRQNGFNYIDNRNIPPTKLYRDRLHLIESGKKILANNFIHGINNYFQVTNFPINILKNEQNKNELDIIGLAKLRQQYPFNPLTGYLNIHFLDHKVDSLREFLKISLLEIICVDETKLDNSFPDQQFKIEGFQFPPFRRDRNKFGGGKIVYVKDGLIANRLTEFETAESETICLESTISNKKWFLMFVYRPPYEPIRKYFLKKLLTLSRSP